MSEEFDLYSEATTVKTLTAVIPGLTIISRSKGVLATLIASTCDDLRMDIISVTDHILEPRDVSEYSIHPAYGYSSEAFVIQRDYTGYHAKLGVTTNRQGAENLLAYLKESAQHG